MVLLSFFLGLIPGLIIVSPVEWLVHKHLLHTPKQRRRWFNRASAFAHNDVHHAAFKGPAHYYRDIVNEDVVIHFHWKHVALILCTATVAGVAVNRVFTFMTQTDFGFGLADGMYVLGLVVATAIGYLGYEINHHYMHVIGQRRLTINRVFGDLLQGGAANRDGKLRFPKPFLDACCNAVEKRVDRHIKKQTSKPADFQTSLIKKFNEYVAYNSNVLKVYLEDMSAQDIFRKITRTMIKWELKKRNSLGRFKKLGYWIDRRVQWLFRGSPVFVGKYFRHIDNNHFMHHHKNDINLNVFLTWADVVFGTRRDSSPQALERDKTYWLCPNSPDTEKFSVN